MSPPPNRCEICLIKNKITLICLNLQKVYGTTRIYKCVYVHKYIFNNRILRLLLMNIIVSIKLNQLNLIFKKLRYLKLSKVDYNFYLKIQRNESPYYTSYRMFSYKNTNLHLQSTRTMLSTVILALKKKQKYESVSTCRDKFVTLYMFYLKKKFRAGPFKQGHVGTRSHVRLLNFNVIFPLIVVKIISQDRPEVPSSYCMHAHLLKTIAVNICSSQVKIELQNFLM